MSQAADRTVDAVGAEHGNTVTESRLSGPQRWILAVTMAATFMAILDSFIVNVAVPSIRADLGASFTQAELTISGYALVYGLLLVTGGRLGDLFGFRRLFVAGVALFTAASLAAGLAQDPIALIAFRMLQAVGAGLFYPQVLSLLQTAFTGRAQARAFAAFGAVLGLASIAGQVIGGLLITLDPYGLSWRSVFLVNIPFGALTLIGALRFLPAAVTTRRGGRRDLDLSGVGLLTVALLLVCVPLTAGQQLGWSPVLWGLLVASLPASAAFVRWELRVAAGSGRPLVDMRLFRRADFSGGIAVAGAFFTGNAGLFFLLSLQLQGGLGLSPLAAGLAFAPLAAAFAGASLVGPKVTARLGQHTLTLGYAINVLGTLALLVATRTAGSGMTVWDTVAPLAVIGFGEGLGVSPLMGTLLSKVPAEDAGSASGVVETMGQVGTALGVGVVGLVFFGQVGGNRAAASHTVVTGAFGTALWVNLGLAAAALVLLPLMFREPRRT